MLKVLCFALVFSSIAVSGAPYQSDGAFVISSTADHVHDALLSDHFLVPSFHGHADRQKRNTDLGSYYGYLDSSTRCLMRCVDQFKRAMQPYKQVLVDRQNAGIYNTNQNLTLFNGMCTDARPAIQCYYQCPDSVVKAAVMKKMDLVRFMCIDSFQAVMDNGPCMNRAQGKCRPKCSRYEGAVNQTIAFAANPALREFYTSDELQNLASDSCKYLDCLSKCSTSAVRFTCGNTAAELITGINQKVFTSSFDITAANEYLYPESCKKLVRFGQGQEMTDGSD